MIFESFLCVMTHQGLLTYVKSILILTNLVLLDK